MHDDGIPGRRVGVDKYPPKGVRSHFSVLDSSLGTIPSPALLGSLAIRETGLVGESNCAGAQGSSLAAQQVAGSLALLSHGPGPTMEEKCGPCVLGEGLHPIPTRLVSRIWKGEFVDMTDHLQDNLEAERRRRRDDGEPSGQSSRLTRRDVPDMLS